MSGKCEGFALSLISKVGFLYVVERRQNASHQEAAFWRTYLATDLTHGTFLPLFPYSMNTTSIRYSIAII